MTEILTKNEYGSAFFRIRYISQEATIIEWAYRSKLERDN